ncbi:MAG TPA: helix-turn-helix transcriptional regulator [Dehalococcoidia bacterium]|nr:helix-turn-helix transcriptional regulator [Dehalococcoidia bacterium]
MTDDDELLLLGALSDAAMHGYELNARLQRWQAYLPGAPRPSTAYARLEQLARQGLVQTHAERPGRYGERRVYGLTEAGRALLRGLLRAALPDPARPVERPALFLRALPPDEWRALLRERLSKLDGPRTELQALVDSHSPLIPVHWLSRLRLGQIETERRWIETLLTEATIAPGDGA